MFRLVRIFWRMGGMAIAYKNGISPSVSECEGHGGSYVPIGPSTLTYWWHGCSVQEWHKSIHFGVWGGMEVVML
jgi:hypothetical protein